MVLCQAELDEELLAIAPPTTCIISTPYDAYRAARLHLPVPRPSGSICRNKDLVCFHLEDRVDDVQDAVLEARDSVPIPFWTRTRRSWAS